MDNENTIQTRQSIRTRVLALILGLTFLSVIVIAYVSVDSILSSGQDAQVASKEIVQKQAEEFLVQITIDNALEKDASIEDIGLDADHIAQFMANIYAAPEAFGSQSFWLSNENMFVAPDGQYINGEDDISTIFTPNFVEINEEFNENLDLSAYFDSLVPAIYESNPDSAAVYLIHQDEFTRLFPNINLGFIIPPDYKATDDIFYTVGAPENNPERVVIWTPVYDDPAGQGLLVSAIAPIYANENEFLGVVGIDLSLAALTTSIEEASPVAGGYSFLINEDGLAIALSQQGYEDIFEKPLDSGTSGAGSDLNTGSTSFVSVIENMVGGETGFQAITANGKDLFVAYAPLPGTGWSLANVVEAENMLQVVNVLQGEIETSTQSLVLTRIIPISIILLITAVIIGLLLTNRLVAPLQKIAVAARKIGDGNWDQVETITPEARRNDEIGVLATAIQNMSIQLKGLVTDLESRVMARTQDLNLAADIGRQISQARDVDDVLSEATISIRDQFNLYQVQIYLTDQHTENLVLRASDGFAGSRLLDMGHKLPVDKHSINGSAAFNGQAVIVADTHESDMFLPHPLLPDTRSEMVVPLMVEDDVLGVMDLQSTEANSLREDILPAFTVLAGQLAIAIMNARQNRAMQENQRLMRTIIDASPDWIFVKNHEHRYQVVNQAYANAFHITPEEFVGKNDLEIGFPEEIVKGNPEKGIRGFWADDREIMDQGETKFIPEEPGEVDGKQVVLQTVKAPLLGTDGNAVGIVGFVHDITNRKEAENIIAKHADELLTVAELSTGVAATGDPQQLIQEVVDLTKDRFSLYHTHIYLLDESGENLVLAAGAGKAGETMVAQGLSIPLSQEQSLVARAARTKEGVIVNDVVADPGFLPNPLLPDTRSEMAVPMIAGNDVLGVLDVQADITERFTEQDIQIKTTLAAQTAVALQNVRQIKQTQQALANAAIFRQLADATTQGVNLSNLQGESLYANPAFLNIVGIDESEEIIGKPIASIYSTDVQERFSKEIIPTLIESGSWQGEIQLGDPENPTITYQNIFILHDETGKPTNSAAVITDITEQKATEERIRANQELMRTIIDSSPDWIFVKDLEHRYQLVNKAYADSFHQTPEEFIGKNDLEIGFPEEIVKGNAEKGISGFWTDDNEIMTSKQMKMIPEELGVVDGQDVVLRTIKAPLIGTNGNATGIVGFVQDITDQKEAQREQERLTQEIEEQLAQMNALQQVMTRDNWDNFASQQKDETGFAFTGKSVEPFDSNSLKALTGGLSIDLEDLAQDAYDESQTAVIMPLQLHNESIGIVGARNANGDPINAEQQALLATLTAQVAESLDRARLLEETEIARSQTESLFSGSQRVVRANNMDEILRAVVEATRLQSYERVNMLFFDKLLTPEENPISASIASIWRKDGQPNIMPNGTTFPVSQYPVIGFLDREAPLFIDDVASDDRFDDETKALLIEQLDMPSVLAVPLIIGNNWLGFILGIANEPQHLTNDNIRQIISLAGQAATVAQSQRLYQEAATRAEREQILRQVSDRVYAAPDAETVLRTAAREIGQALGLETFIYLEDELEEEKLPPTE